MQVQANTLGILVLISANDEATALGAAICAGVGSGLFSNLGEGGEALVASFTTVDPEPAMQAQYEPHYQRWCRAFEMRSESPDGLIWEPLQEA